MTGWLWAVIDLGLVSGFGVVKNGENVLSELEILDDAFVNLVNGAGATQVSQRRDERVHQLVKCGDFGHILWLVA